MIRFLQKLRNWLELAFKTRSLSLASQLSDAEVWSFHLSRRAEGLWIDPMGISLATALQWPWLLKSLNGAIHLRQEGGAVFAEQQGQLGMTLKGLNLTVTTGEELFTADEVFIKNVYRFIPHQPVVVIDIGMNVGYSSLLFASRPEVIGVYSFEPFPQTYQQALINIQLNPACAGKIHAENVGLASADHERTAAYDVTHKGGSTMYAQADAEVGGAAASIKLRNAVNALDAVSQAHQGTPIVVKMDCEGAEYEIMEAWAAGQQLSRISLIMIEWHRLIETQDPSRLCKLLVDAGFDLFAREDFREMTGMIYAIRSASL